MSGIYGFTYNDDLDVNIKDALDGLIYWNHIYGREASDACLFGGCGIGCNVEHFCEDYPSTAPILKDDNHMAVIDALLFNRDELIPMLHMKPDQLLSDEELLFRLVSDYGWNVLSTVNGDFAGAVYDRHDGTWTLFRDHMGVRPLYYYYDNNLIAFSTDIRGTASMPGADLSLDELQFYTTLRGANPLTLTGTEFSHIRAVRPASILHIRFSEEGVNIDEQIYWEPGKQKIRFCSDAQYEKQLRSLVTDAVDRRCDAISGMLGAELSGGLDSSVIDILINRHGREAKYYSWSFGPDVIPITDARDERNIVDAICVQEQITCRYRSPSDGFSFESKGEWLKPYFVDTPKLSYGSSWLASQGAKVVFSGHGGDEGISHRSRNYELWHAKEYGAYFRLYLELFKGKACRALRAVRTGLNEARLDAERIREYLEGTSDFTSFFTPDFAERMQQVFTPKPFTFNYDAITFITQGGTRPRLDNAAYQGAVNGVRYLFPYVDYRVIDFAVSIPRAQYLTPKQNRAVFRNAFRDILPDSLYSVSLKQTISTSTLPSSPNKKERYKDSVRYILNRMDRSLWEPYLDFDRLEAVLMEHDGSSGGIGSIDTLLTNLNRYLLVQEMRMKSQNWRQYDEHDKTV